MNSLAYYNENDPKAAAWLRELIRAELIAPGDVDERDIRKVQADDVAGYTQAHFFAGIGGWSLALRMAGWPDDRPVWTGSCPCQPYSLAGNRKGDADDRNLWPDLCRLVIQCQAVRIFGEQVESAVAHGWLDGISSDLEASGYTVGAAVLGAHSVSAPHRRNRLYWVADTDGGQSWNGQLQPCWQYGQQPQDGFIGQRMGYAGRQGLSERIGNGHVQREAVGTFAREATERGGDAGFWSAFDLIPCRDGKARRVEPSSFPLAHGVPARVGRLRGYGNAIVPQVAATFIGAYLDAVGRECA